MVHEAGAGRSTKRTYEGVAALYGALSGLASFCSLMSQTVTTSLRFARGDAVTGSVRLGCYAARRGGGAPRPLGIN